MCYEVVSSENGGRALKKCVVHGEKAVLTDCLRGLALPYQNTQPAGLNNGLFSVSWRLEVGGPSALIDL